MVDTALVSDLIFLAMEDDGSWLIVVGQDADLVPGILTAEGLLQGTDRRVIFLARGGINNSNPPSSAKSADILLDRRDRLSHINELVVQVWQTSVVTR